MSELPAPRRLPPPVTVPKTRLVHSGTLRSQYGETSEALFSDPRVRLRQCRGMRGAIQGRGSRLFSIRAFSNPNVAMFERRMIELEGAEAAPRHRHRHGSSDDGGAGAAEGRRPRGGGESDVRLVPLCGGRPAAALWHCLDAGSTASISTSGKRAMRPNTRSCFPGEPDQSDARRARHRRHRRKSRHAARRAVDRRQCVRNPRSGRARWKLGADVVVYSATQAYRRPGPLPRRKSSCRRRRSSPNTSTPSCARPVHRCRRSNAWVLLKRAGDAGGCACAPRPRPPPPWPRRWRSTQKSRG